MKKILLTVAAALFAAAECAAAVTMPRVFGDNMVLQQGQRVPVWGKAAPGEKVTVSFAGQTATATADAQGRWKTALAPLKACAEGGEFRVAGENALTFKNVVVGEVWFCSGQSNMEFTMSSRRKVKDWEKEVAAANWPLIRHFNVAHKISLEPLDDVEAVWEVTTPQTIPPQSAVAFFFGETIHKTLMVAGLVPFAIKGAIWYQGCHNMRDGAVYLDKTVSLVRGWRREWGQGDFPYFLVQLAPVFQEAQARVQEKVPNSGYTVINDVGAVNDIHPTDKRTVGMRMADQALDRVYGTFTRPWRTPTLKGYKVEGNALRVSLADAEGLKTRDGLPPNEFELRGVCGTWVPAQAKIEGTDVVLTAPGVEEPLAMRFAAYNGSTPNLVNGAGLPVGPFRCGAPVPMGAAEKLPELKDMTCVQRFNIPVNELQDMNGETSFALAAMDAFAPKSDDLVLTAKAGARQVRQPVANLTVRTNVSFVKPLTNSPDGFIEFYGSSYTAKRSSTPKGGDDKLFDFNDTPTNPSKFGYGCLQVHDLAAKKTVFSFNHFNNAKVACDVGIGTATSGNPDWTFSANAGQYKARRISVWVK